MSYPLCNSYKESIFCENDCDPVSEMRKVLGEGEDSSLLVLAPLCESISGPTWNGSLL